MPPTPIPTLLACPQVVNKGNKGKIPPYGGATPLSPYRTDAGFAAAQLWDYERITQYVERARHGSVSPVPWVMRDMEPCNARYHQASNRHGRLILAELLLEAVRRAIPPDVGIYLVTVSPRQYVLPVGEPSKAMLKSLECFTRQAIGNSPGIGIIEPGLYVGCQADGPRLYGDVISWHAHLIVWGVSLAELHRFRAALGPQHFGITGRTCVWIKPITREEAEIYARYMCKAPTSQYRLQRTRGEETDDETGEIFYNHRQNKEPLWRRPRRLVQLANTMRDLFMDDLVFGSGEGTPVARDLIAAITAPRRREDEAEAARTEIMQEQRRLAAEHAEHMRQRFLR